ncbi:VanZ family protein [Neobacillus kokaensis]|uniref:VanZ-like domain-containing protein n=1 Tax=Neobacillus kokaensis TaxID=2759023 RepID=A0ABQ3N6N4_9BACI|nr:VanZ family protein [Neobacillus kokaensis]GHI00599.1 hypothetical protein AM1BK_41410 [Neobacillus kokaensis]
MKILIKTVLTIVLFLYLAILTKLVLFKYVQVSEIIQSFTFINNEHFLRAHNFIPFKTIYYYLFLADINLIIRIENIVGNVIGFAPFGFILPLLANRFQKLKVVILATFFLSLTYELMQLIFTFGSFDVDDLILNTIGGVIGFIPIKIFLKLVGSRRKRGGKVNEVF